MTLLSRATKAVQVTDDNDTLHSVPLGTFSDLGNIRTSSGEWVGTDSALRIVTVYACVRILAETIASLPLRLYRDLPDGGKAKYNDHPLYDVLRYQPNHDMTSFVWRETMMSHLATWGNSYNEIAFDPNGRMNLWPLRPDRVEVAYENGKRVYDYLTPLGGKQRLRPNSVFHVPGLSSNGLKGYSPIALHREALGLYQAAQSFGTNFFRNNARPAVVLSHPRNLSAGAIERLAVQMQDLKGSANAGKTVTLEEGMTITEIGIPPEDAQYIETRRFQMQEIARMFRVPPHMIGDLERATFSNIEHQSIEFVNSTIAPWIERIKQEIKSQLLFGEDDVSVDFSTYDLLRGDAKSLAEALNIQRNAGVINADEWREIENRNPIEDGSGQEYWRPLNMLASSGESEPAAPSSALVPVIASGNGTGRVAAEATARAIGFVTPVTPYMSSPAMKYSEDQERDDNGRFGSGGGGGTSEAERGAAELGAGVDKFESAGGTVETTQGYAASREAKGQFADMAGRMPEGWANEPGPHATNSVFNTVSSSTEYQIARDADGAMAGAMHMSGPGGLHPDSMQIDLIGSTGIVPGAGSALVREAVREAASRDVGISLTPLTDAKPFWTRMGLGEGNRTVAEGGGWGATADQVRQMAARLGTR